MKTFLLIVQLIPAIITLVKQIEEVIPTSGQGAAKITAIRQILEVSYDEFQDVWPVIEKVIASLVNLFNVTGVFKK